MTRAQRAAVILASLVPIEAAAAEGVPLPRGWIGTTAEWIQGFGIAFVLLSLALLVVSWRSLRRGDVTPTATGSSS